LLAEGLCNAEIARRQVVTLGTIENRLTAVYAKLNVASRAQAVAWYYERGRLAMEESAVAARGDGATAGRDDGRSAMRPDRRDAARPASWLACEGTPEQVLRVAGLAVVKADRLSTYDLDYPLAGRVFCGSCGAPCRPRSQGRPERGQWYSHYQCDTSIARGRRPDLDCAAPSIPADWLEAATRAAEVRRRAAATRVIVQPPEVATATDIVAIALFIEHDPVAATMNRNGSQGQERRDLV
jgi:hypothetical protein